MLKSIRNGVLAFLGIILIQILIVPIESLNVITPADIKLADKDLGIKDKNNSKNLYDDYINIHPEANLIQLTVAKFSNSSRIMSTDELNKNINSPKKMYNTELNTYMLLSNLLDVHLSTSPGVLILKDGKIGNLDFNANDVISSFYPVSDDKIKIYTYRSGKLQKDTIKRSDIASSKLPSSRLTLVSKFDKYNIEGYKELSVGNNMVLAIDLISKVKKVNLKTKTSGAGYFDKDGNTQPVEFIQQRLVTAVNNGITDFYISTNNYSEANKFKKANNLKINIVPIKTISELAETIH